MRSCGRAARSATSRPSSTHSTPTTSASAKDTTRCSTEEVPSFLHLYLPNMYVVEGDTSVAMLLSSPAVMQSLEKEFAAGVTDLQPVRRILKCWQDGDWAFRVSSWKLHGAGG